MKKTVGIVVAAVVALVVIACGGGGSCHPGDIKSSHAKTQWCGKDGRWHS